MAISYGRVQTLRPDCAALKEDSEQEAASSLHKLCALTV